MDQEISEKPMINETVGNERGVGSRSMLAARWIAAALFMLALGLMLGLAIMGVFDLAYAVIELVWIDWNGIADVPFYPLIPATLAGVALILIAFRYGKPERPMDSMGAAAKEAADEVEVRAAASGYSNGPRRPLPVRIADFLLPFAGGGPVGVAMGLVGFIMSGCAWAKRRVMSLCGKFGILAGEKDFSKRQKTLLYTIGIVGGFVGAAAVVELFGLGMVIPRVEAAPISLEAVGIGALVAVAGWVLGLAYVACAKLAKRLWEHANKAQRLLPLVCGIVLGVSMIFLPHVGLPGSDAYSSQLMGNWQEVGPAVLIATALVRTVLIAFLLNMGWSGGPFFPIVYCSICLGLGIAGAFGADAGTCVAAAVGAALVAFSGQPLMGVAALMCCPVESIPVIAVAVVIAAGIPRPKSLKGDFARRR